MKKPDKKKSTLKVFQVVTTVRSKDGTRPITRILGGDTVFTYLIEGQTATTVNKLVKPAAGKKGDRV